MLVGLRGLLHVSGPYEMVKRGGNKLPLKRINCQNYSAGRLRIYASLLKNRLRSFTIGFLLIPFGFPVKGH